MPTDPTRWWWLAVAPLALLPWPQAVVVAVVVCALAGAALPRRRIALSRLAATGALAAVLHLALLLVGDRFDVRYVWLYSHSELPTIYKLANLWGGDEGTLLLLCAIMASAALALARRRGWAGPGALLLAAACGIGAAIWTPFAAGEVANEGRGMNVHLMRVWMLIHPPFVFAAYALFIAPAGAALQALATGRGDWGAIAARWTRLGWLVLTAGLVAGMWWAYEDFTFGQFWHWDPVQTSVFMVWALATAQLHTLRRYRADGGGYGRLHPLLGLGCAVTALVSLVITRHPALASSHRYVGDTSFPWLLAVAAALATATIAAFVASRRRRLGRTRANESAILIAIAALTMTGCAAIGAGIIAEAYVSHALGLPRPEKFKPFFEFLARWTSSAEAERLRDMFDRWDIDRYHANALLAPLGIVIGLAGGHNFVPIRARFGRWALTLSVAAACVAVPAYWQPMAAQFTGKGLTSANTTAIFWLIEALSVAMAYLGLAALAWGVAAALRRRHALGRYYLPVGGLHFAAVMALAAGTIASVFDVYHWRNLDYPEDFAQPIRFPGGYEVTVAVDHERLARDGARVEGGGPALHAVAQVHWTLVRDGATVETATGAAAYRDADPQASRDLGPVRLMCEIVDYRYARTVSGATQMIDPFIHRGLWRDVQVWLPAVAYETGADGVARAPSTVPVVLKIYPAMSWLWFGLIGLVLGAAAAMVPEMRRAGRPTSAPPSAAL